MVMTRTSDEIKKGLACADVHTCPDEKCPYYASCAPCELQVQVDALALIQQLQAENAEKDKSMQQLERSLSFACDLADGLKAATVKQEQELYVSEERNRQLETQNAELSGKIGQLEAERDALKEALGLMVYQYCVRGDKLDHLYMCAGETAFRVLGLEQYGNTSSLESWLFPEFQDKEE